MKDYLHVAEELASRVARESDRIDRERKIPAELVHAIADKKFFRLLVPRSLHGEEMDWLEYLRIIELFAEADASTAWCLNQNNVFATYAAKMPEQTAKEIWSDPRAVVANGPPSSAFACPVDGGYLLSGQWNFSSGSPHATWLAAIAPVVSPEAEPRALPEKENEVRILLVPRDDVEFIDDWQVAGLRGTGSLSFKADKLFVPYPRTFDPSDEAREPGALYAISINLLFASGFATTALGAARSALDTAIELAARKKQRMEKDRLLEKSTSHRMVGKEKPAGVLREPSFMNALLPFGRAHLRIIPRRSRNVSVYGFQQPMRFVWRPKWSTRPMPFAVPMRFLQEIQSSAAFKTSMPSPNRSRDVFPIMRRRDNFILGWTRREFFEFVHQRPLA